MIFHVYRLLADSYETQSIISSENKDNKNIVCCRCVKRFKGLSHTEIK